VPTLFELVTESRERALSETVGDELAGATAKTLLELAEAARDVDEELEDLVATLGQRSDAHERLRRALIALDCDLTRTRAPPLSPLARSAQGQ
jgi:hypothetical protein